MPDFNEKLFGRTPEQQWREYVVRMKTELETDFQLRLNGISNSQRGKMRAGYTDLRRFFDGDQWNYMPEGGGNPRIYNFCFSIVNHYTAFMTNEPVDFDVPSADNNDEIENARAEVKENILKKILHDDNNFDTMYEEAVFIGSQLGDSFIFGPIIRGKGKDKKIVFNRVKKPENIKVIWSDDSYDEIVGFIRTYWLTEDVAEKLFGEKIKERKLRLNPTIIHNRSASGADRETSLRMVEFNEYWDGKVMHQLLSDQTLDHFEHGYGFVPLQYIKNIPDPNRPWGISDIENVLDIQAEYNEKNFDLSNITTDEANPKIFGKNLDPATINAGAMELIELGDEAELMVDPRRSAVPPLSEIINLRRNGIFEIGGIPEILFGGQNVKEFSGRALSVFMQPVNNRIKGRQTRWTKALKGLTSNIFKLLEQHFGASDLVGGVYDVDIFFPGTLLRNTTDEINKFNAKVQSMRTTMKNIGVSSPRDEIEIMKKEYGDPVLTAEISRAPQIQLQLALQKGNQNTQGEPQINEGDNQEGDQPAAQAGAGQGQSPQSGEGRVRQRNQQRGASVPIEE